ncbi:hypothetical protein LEM8419_03120 [Neolewinella maritima]|uniref:Lipoprotein n=1 Tax=Neolewinella maritima TaxID=1383882 RepID=A0ABM9B4R9_9BACT|nr:hypothetical protein [Neolewinella maritima]CAH1002203.1 hypothetical protein LEM8419_03120 [Neolewinella maritima]
MIRTVIRYAVCLAVLSFSGCGAEPKEKQPAAPSYPPLPLERLTVLWDSATTYDVVFNELPISASQQNLGDIQQSLTYIASDAPQIDPDCTPVGHVWFQAGPNRGEEADLYFSAGCVYYLWYENGRPAYANALTEAGVVFYNNILRQAQQAQPQ